MLKINQSIKIAQGTRSQLGQELPAVQIRRSAMLTSAAFRGLRDPGHLVSPQRASGAVRRPGHPVSYLLWLGVGSTGTAMSL